MFSMHHRWERFFHLVTYIAQGSSYLNPRGYAILHREHHAYSDGTKDPHSPRNFRNVLAMMVDTKRRYDDHAYHRVIPEPRFLGGYPEWPALDRLGQSWTARIAWCCVYGAFYWTFATAWWMWLFLPVHFVMGPIHGAIVNWCGHRYGYQTFDNGDDSRNTFPLDLVTMGELFQNNHHRASMSPNFASRWFEIDPGYVFIRLLALCRIIDLGATPQGVRR